MIAVFFLERPVSFLCSRSFIINFILIDLDMTDVLIVTSETDNHVNVVIKELQQSDVQAIRLNSESFIQKSQYFYEWQASGNPSQSFLSFEDSLKEVQNIGVIWWRKPEEYQVFPEVNDDWAIKYCREETE